MRAEGARLLLKYSIAGNTVRRAMQMALIVGPLLTVINQTPKLIALDFDFRFFLQAGLTFCVPYMVSTVSSAMTELANARTARHGAASDRPGSGSQGTRGSAGRTGGCASGAPGAEEEGRGTR
jgi:hypothetical protein